MQNAAMNLHTEKHSLNGIQVLWCFFCLSFVCWLGWMLSICLFKTEREQIKCINNIFITLPAFKTQIFLVLLSLSLISFRFFSLLLAMIVWEILTLTFKFWVLRVIFNSNSFWFCYIVWRCRRASVSWHCRHLDLFICETE